MCLLGTPTHNKIHHKRRLCRRNSCAPIAPVLALSSSSASLRSLGFDLANQCSVAPYLPADFEFAPTVCVSDTRLLPHETFYADDAPALLLEVLRALDEHHVFVLGDFLESIPLGESEIDEIVTAVRLGPLFSELSGRRELRVVPGNHDIKADRALVTRFGARRIYSNGFRVGRIRFEHGHRNAADGYTEEIADFGSALIPIGVTLQRLGVPIPLQAANEDIFRATCTKLDFLVFGHTHAPEISSNYANTGCFLRTGEQTVVTLSGSRLSLWSRSI